MPATRNSRSVSHCQFAFSDGRRCALPLSPHHPHLCLTHALRERRLLDADQIAAELTAMSARIRTASDLNYFLTRLVFYTASQRIPRSTARTLASLAWILVQNIRSVKNEVTIAHGYEEWRELLRQTVPDASGVRRHAAPERAPSSGSHAAAGGTPSPAAATSKPAPTPSWTQPKETRHDASQPGAPIDAEEPVEAPA